MNQKIFIITKICRTILSNYLSRKTTAFVSLLMLLAFSSTTLAQNSLVPFKFTLSNASTTSAGIFKKDSTLVRTLWNNVRYPAGTHTAYWDRKDDDGYMVSDTSYVVHVVSGNMTYKWDGGIIGNTSDSTTGSSKHRYFEKPNSMAIFGNTAYFSSGYGEGISSAYKLDLSAPQNRKSILSQHSDVDQNSDYTCTDGKNVYWAGYDAFNPGASFVYGTTVLGDKEVKFSSGVSHSMTYGRTYAAAIDRHTGNSKAHPSGMAGQKTGNFLFVSHKEIDELHILNKTTGALVQSISIKQPRGLCVDMNDNLWIISDVNTVEKYSVDVTGALSSSPILVISGLSDPVALAVSPNNYLIAIADAGTSQQVKAFDNASGNSVWTLGQAGGYATDATVEDDKFFFRDVDTRITGGVLFAFQPDSSFWIGDPGNDRVQHFDASGNFIDNIMAMPCLYSVKADPNDPSRVFGNFLEFKIDYSKPLAANNGSWKLVKNWRKGTPANYFGAFSILRNVITLSNGRTYATMEDPDNITHELVELPSTGNLRFTGIKFNTDLDFLIDIDGSFRTIITGGVTDSIQWTSKPLTGFNGSNNPIWGKAVTIASSPKTTINDPKANGQTFPVKTTSNRLITFCPRKSDGYGYRGGYHLGAIKKGTNKWLWRTSKSTPASYMGPMPTDGSFDLGNGVEYPAGGVYTIDNNIFWNYNGEFWKNSQTNIWNHYADNGLMIGQFGITAPEGQSLYGPEAFPMGAGNVFSSVFVKVDTAYYLYHNDESVHGAVHRWKITGMNTVKTQSSTISLKTVSGGLTVAYFNGTDLNNFNFAATEVTPTVNHTSAPSQVSDASKYSARWTGFVKPDYSQNYTFYTTAANGVRLWVNGKLMINQWNNTTSTQYTSSTIALLSGIKYNIKLETNGGAVSLSWSSSSQAKQIISSGNLFPAQAPDYKKGIDLMEGLTYKTILTNGMYGWNRNSINEDSTSGQQFWRVETGVKSFSQDRPDVFIRFRKKTGNCFITRDLGQTPQCLTSWKLSGVVGYDGNYPKFDDDNGGGYIDVLDDQGKIIVRINPEQYIKNNTRFVNYQCNGKKVFETSEGQFYPVVNRPQPFELTITGTVVQFKYGNYPAITTSLFDNTSHWNMPKSVKFHFMSSVNASYDRMLTLHELSILMDAPELPVITASGPTIFCAGNSVTLTSSSSNSYLWSNSATTQSTTVSASGTYSVTVKDVNGCPLTSVPKTILVNTLPTPVVTGPAAYCKGSSINLTTGNYATYLWNTNATTRNIPVSSTGNYSVSVVDANGCAGTSAAVTITENALPTAVATANGPTAFCQGKSVVLSSNPAVSYIWSNTEATQSISATASGSYTVKITDANGCTSAPSAPVVVQVDPIPVPTVTASGVIIFCDGNNVTLTSSPATSYLWSNFETTQSIIVTKTGNYTVNAMDANGCSAPSVPLPVTVNAIPAPVVSVASDTLLTSSFVNGNQWYFNGSILPGAISKYLIASKEGEYYVAVTDNNCTGNSPAVTVKKGGNSSLNELSAAGISIYPNPGNGKFTIESATAVNAAVRICNILGEVVYEGRLEGISQVDLSHLSPGVYQVQVNNASSAYSSRIVIQ
jgi:hypothetical protein